MNTQHRFELWRQLHKELDPALPEEARQIVTKTREWFPVPSDSIEVLWQKIVFQDRLNDEHMDKIGRYVQQAEMANICVED